MLNNVISLAANDNRFDGLKTAQLTASEKQSVVTLAMKILAIKHRARRLLNKPAETRNYLQLLLADRKHEMFGCIFLDTRHRVITLREMFQGTIDGASVHPRVVVQAALEVNASAVVFFHNHPSGTAEPSEADRRITRRLTEALRLIDVTVLDHFVVSASESVSFAERGWI